MMVYSKEGHTKYRKVLTLTLLDAIKFQIVLYYGIGEINIIWYKGQKISQFCQFYFKHYV